MTYPYSCQGGSMGEHTFEDKKEHKIDAFSKMSFKECSYLGHLQYEVIQKMLPRTAAQMKAMQDSFLGYRGNPLIQWTTPVGFRASQYKPLIEKNHLKLYFDNRKDIRVVIFTETDKPNLREHKMGISPNVIHSLDASMMVMTLCKMIDTGITNLSAIHDQYQSHSGDIDVLGRKAREAFFDIILVDPIEKIMVESVGRYNSPKKGKWNPKDVLDANYFLC